MNTRKLYALFALALLATTMLAPWSAASANATGLASIHGPGTARLAAIGPDEIFRITFTTAHCRETNESTDEIYVMFAVISPGGLFVTPGMVIFTPPGATAMRGG